MSEEKKSPKIEVYAGEGYIIGSVEKIDNRVSNSGKRFAIISVKCAGFKDEMQTFEVTVFQKGLEECIDSKLKEGDDVAMVVRLKSEPYNGKNYAKYMFSKIVQIRSNNCEAKAMKESAEPNPIDDNEQMPF